MKLQQILKELKDLKKFSDMRKSVDQKYTRTSNALQGAIELLETTRARTAEIFYRNYWGIDKSIKLPENDIMMIEMLKDFDLSRADL